MNNPKKLDLDEIGYAKLRDAILIHRVMLDRLMSVDIFPSQELIDFLDHIGKYYQNSSCKLQNLHDNNEFAYEATKALVEHEACQT